MERIVRLEALMQVFQQIAFVGAVLGGFAVTLFVGLLPMAPGRRVVAVAAALASLSASALAVATVAGVSGVVSALLEPEQIEPGGAIPPVLGAFEWAARAFMLGMFALLVSLGLCGWVRSRAFGLVTSTIAGIAIVSLIGFLTVVMRAI